MLERSKGRSEQTAGRAREPEREKERDREVETQRKRGEREGERRSGGKRHTNTKVLDKCLTAETIIDLLASAACRGGGVQNNPPPPPRQMSLKLSNNRSHQPA